MESGSIQKKISQANLNKQKILDVPLALQKEYEEKVKPFVRRFQNNVEQIDCLQRLRDELLPMLLNGQISVNEIKGYDFTPRDVPMAAEP